METTGKRAKFKRRYLDSKSKHGSAGHAAKCICCRKNRPAIDRLTSPGQMKSAAMLRAEEVQSNLESAFPSFVKCMVRSHVGSCFWMGLPGPFCRAHLPREDAIVTLEDEAGLEFKMKYFAHKTGLSAGWRQFAVAHQLLEGDALVFQFIDYCRMKVYIIRANNLREVDGALGLLTLDPQTKQNEAEDTPEINTPPYNRKRRSLPLSAVQKKNKRSGRSRPSIPNPVQLPDQSENDSEETSSEVLEDVKFSLPSVQFEDIKSFEDFNIMVDGLSLDAEISEDIRKKYFNLCCSQNNFLHENLIKGINFKLIAGIISETVNIADAIKACSLTTSKEEFDTWDKTLRASEHFGMNVGFLLNRLNRLVTLAYDSDSAAKTRRYIEATAEKNQTEDEIRNLETKLVELKAARNKFGSDIESLKSKAESYELKFREVVLSPW